MQAALNTSTRDTPAAHALQVASPLEEALTSICAEAQGVCVVDFEEASDEAVSGLRGRADALLAQSIDLLRFVSAEYVEPAEAAAQEIRAAGDVGDRPSAIPPGVEAIADVLMLAHLGIRSRQRRLAELPSDASRWDVLAALGSSLRTIQKSLAAVRRAMSAA
ncbi:MAG: hypothetical protein R3F14_47695, partial [Polyangiaceae bacterium]